MTDQVHNGVIEVICGPMFSGKTSELIRRLERLTFADKKFMLFKPSIDTRYSETDVVSHTKKALKCIAVNQASDILIKAQMLSDIKIIAIDEVQFFERNEQINIFDVCVSLKNDGYLVIVNGLDMDCEGKNFGMMGELMGVADNVQKLKAVCMVPGCGQDAGMSFKYSLKKNNMKDNVVELGESEAYESRCHTHWKQGQEQRDTKDDTDQDP